MPNSAEAVASQVLQNATAQCQSHYQSTRMQIECDQCLRQLMTDALILFAAQQVQQTWEEAIKAVEQNHEYHQAMHGRCKCSMIANSLRRRAQEPK